MLCPNCNSDIQDGSKFCTKCGATVPDAVSVAAPVQPATPAPQPAASYTAPQYPQNGYQAPPSYASAPPAYNGGYAAVEPASPPVSVIAYVGLFILSALPVVGLIAMIIMAIAAKNKSLKNFCIATIILAVIGIVVGIIFSVAFASVFRELAYELAEGGFNYYY